MMREQHDRNTRDNRCQDKFSQRCKEADEDRHQGKHLTRIDDEEEAQEAKEVGWHDGNEREDGGFQRAWCSGWVGFCLVLADCDGQHEGCYAEGYPECNTDSDGNGKCGEGREMTLHNYIMKKRNDEYGRQHEEVGLPRSEARRHADECTRSRMQLR